MTLILRKREVFSAIWYIPEWLTSNLKDEPDFKNVLNAFKKGVEAICKDMIQRCPNYHHYITGPLFFQLKKLAEEKVLLDDSIVEYVLELHKEYDGLDVPLAIYLLGIILGRENLYDSYYDDCKLPCFQKHEPTLPSEEPAEDATTSPAEPTLPSEDSKKDVDTSSAEPTLPSEDSKKDVEISSAEPALPSEDSKKDVETSSAEPALPSEEPAKGATTSPAEPVLPAEGGAADVTTSPNNRKKNTGSSRSKKAKTKLEEKDLFQNNISN